MTKDKIKKPGSRKVKKSNDDYYDKLAQQEYLERWYMLWQGTLRGPLRDAKVSKR